MTKRMTEFVLRAPLVKTINSRPVDVTAKKTTYVWIASSVIIMNGRNTHALKKMTQCVYLALLVKTTSS